MLYRLSPVPPPKITPMLEMCFSVGPRKLPHHWYQLKLKTDVFTDKVAGPLGPVDRGRVITGCVSE